MFLRFLYQTALDDEEFGLDLGADILGGGEVAVESKAVAPAAAVVAAAPVVAAAAPVVQKVAAPAVVAAPSSSSSSSSVSESASATTTSASAATVAVGGVAAGVTVSAEEAALLKRAARFGIQPVPAVAAKVEQSKKTLRAERFGLPVPEVAAAGQQAKAQGQGQGNKKGGKGSAGAVKVAGSAQALLADPELAAKFQKRAERFGGISTTLQEVQKVQLIAEEVSEWCVFFLLLYLTRTATLCSACKLCIVITLIYITITHEYKLFLNFFFFIFFIFVHPFFHRYKRSRREKNVSVNTRMMPNLLLLAPTGY